MEQATDMVVITAGERASRVARELVKVSFERWGMDDWDARVVVAELVTNAWLHGCGGRGLVIVVRVWLRADGLAVVEVWDPSEVVPVKVSPGIHATSGRGLLLIDQLAKEWGARRLETGGKVVYAAMGA